MPLAPGITAALSDIVGRRYVVLAGDQPTEPTPGMLVDAAVFPGTTDEVAQVMRGATACDVAVQTPAEIVLRDGDCGRITLDLSRVDKVLEIDTDGLVPRVQPEAAIALLYLEVEAAGLDGAYLPRPRRDGDPEDRSCVGNQPHRRAQAGARDALERIGCRPFAGRSWYT